MHFLDQRDDKGASRRTFMVKGERGEIPGVLWTPPSSTGPTPLVLVGHGASGSKNQDYVVSLCRRFVTEHGFSAAAIDGPVHGDRRQDRGIDGRLQFLDFAQAWASDLAMADNMVDDWRRTLDELVGLGLCSDRVGYWGLSMGTILGLPLAAADPRISVAVLGLVGLAGPVTDRLERDAPRLGCPVLFLVQWSDELFHRASAFELFDLIGSADKTLHANPGAHGAVPTAEFVSSADFVAKHLTS